ncbi:uncharacterized protein LOC119670123 isoform X2 [Teleopsis dalmanni]|uniref:uncharacterized protein LOC119670123 isoform X2 n=1 Tax=Teleopsis dalmanni TaxID=139649 RepID=UPI0018CCA475|nr:uncharacterized protein LOC119670123 isoform X2 [Teleopsis dalmanni]
MSAILINQSKELNTVPSTPSRNSYNDNGTYSNDNGSRDLCIDSNICEQLLGDKMSALDINEVILQNCDGSDSGVDITTNANVTLQRALSNNSGGYTSSNGGLDETSHGLNMSCDSSMISCSSDLYELKTGIVTAAVMRTATNYECCSENGSESSSLTGTAQPIVRRSNSVKKKVAMFEPGGLHSISTPIVKNAKERDVNDTVSPAAGQLSSEISTPVRSRPNGLKRTTSLSRPQQNATSQARERIAERQSINKGASVTPFRGTQTRIAKPQKPDSLPNVLSRTQSASMQRLVIQRTPSLSRARTPGTPSDDGRWPGTSTPRNISSATKRGMSVAPDLISMKARSNAVVSDLKTNIINPYSTMPRRRKQKSVEDLTGRSSRSSSISRESRMTSSVILPTRKNLANSYNTPTHTKTLPTTTATSKIASVRKLQQPKTRIYHETSVQTALTSVDIDKAFSGGVSNTRPVDAAEQREQQTQTDIRDRELERLRDENRLLTVREQELSGKLQREREEKLSMQRELHLNTERVMGMLEMARIAGGSQTINDVGTPTSDDGGHDSLLMLESQIQLSGHELFERQQEIGQLRQLCRSLQLEMERSLATQECLLQEKAEIEQESNELQDFLQHEKVTMCDALKEIESEYQHCKQQLSNRDEEVKVLRDECRHLVRLNEQRRQENRMLQAKYSALENKSKELIQQKNTSIVAASTSLSGLHTRLDNLVEQLISSYSISEQDLEDIGFQSESQLNSIDGSNENDTISIKTYANGIDASASLSIQQQMPLSQGSDGSLSPQRNQSFIAAVISAIRNATTPSGKRLLARNVKRMGNQGSNTNNNSNQNYIAGNDGDSDSTEMLDSETEPCLMMDNVLEDVNMPDSHSHNMVSSCTGMISQIEVPSELLNVNSATCDDSLQNLSQAITNRQQMELQINAMAVPKIAIPTNHHDNCVSDDISCHDSVAEMPSLVEYCSVQTVVDQVIEVDSLVTKLLKVLRLIQMDNDNCIQQLIVDKNKLQQNKEDMLEKLKDLEDVNMKLQDELMDATQELMLKNNDLTSTKAEMQRHRNEIDKPQSNSQDNNERLLVYANQLENVMILLNSCKNLASDYPALEELRKGMETIKLNANWTHVLETKFSTNNADDDEINANESIN